MGVMAEVEAALGTVLGAATPAEGFRRLVSRQSTGAVTAGLVLVWCSTKCTMWRELELRWERGKLKLLAQTWSRRRNGNNRLAGVGQPEGGSRCWRMARRMHLRK